MDIVPQSGIRSTPAAASLDPLTVASSDPYAAAMMLGLTVLPALDTAAPVARLDLTSRTLTVRFDLGLTDEQIYGAMRAELVRGYSPAPSRTLTFRGTVIRDRGAMLSLTDAWKAAGADPSKTPGKWREIEATKAFVAYVRETIPGADSLIETREGRGGGTWAHWQIAMAYAKYLSPAFHSWCNEVVRSHMEGTSAPPPRDPDPGQTVRALRAEVTALRQLLASNMNAFARMLTREVAL